VPFAVVSLRVRLLLLVLLALAPTLGLTVYTQLEQQRLAMAGAAGDGPDASLYVAADVASAELLAELARRQAAKLAVLIAVSAAALAVAWSVGHFSIVRPVKRLVGAARRLGRGDLGARSGLRRGGDELGELAAAFDEMAAALEAREAALWSAKAELERRVDERTAALRRAIDQLRHELVERRRAEDEALAGLRRAELLLTTSGALNDGTTEEQVRRIIVDSAACLVDGGDAVLWMADEASLELRAVEATAGLRRLLGQRGPWWESALAGDTAEPPAPDATGLSAVLPLMIGPALLAMVSIHQSEPRPLSAQQHTLLKAFANQAATALRNIRLREELAQSLASLAARTRLLEDKTHEQEVFIYTVAHDLKAPLVSLQGLTSILAADYGDRLDAEGRRYLDRIAANAEKLQGLLRDLLEISRIGRVDVDVQAVDLGVVVAGVIEQLRHSLEARAATVAVEGTLPTVWANPTRMAQVLTNLIDNAVKYTPPERAPRITICATEHATEWQITIADNGIGIPAAMRERVFGVFQRLPGAMQLNPTGSGVGLAIVARIIATHGGRYWLESDEGAGTVFHFTLPRPEASATPPAALAGAAG
jgi:signal transduction histidine kinase